MRAGGVPRAAHSGDDVPLIHHLALGHIELGAVHVGGAYDALVLDCRHAIRRIRAGVSGRYPFIPPVGRSVLWNLFLEAPFNLHVLGSTPNPLQNCVPAEGNAVPPELVLICPDLPISAHILLREGSSKNVDRS